MTMSFEGVIILVPPITILRGLKIGCLASNATFELRAREDKEVGGSMIVTKEEGIR